MHSRPEKFLNVQAKKLMKWKKSISRNFFFGGGGGGNINSLRSIFFMENILQTLKEIILELNKSYLWQPQQLQQSLPRVPH